MDEKENKIPEEAAETDTVMGDNVENKENKEDNAPARARGSMSPRTKKRLITVAIATGAILLALAILLGVMAILNNRPPKFEDVRGRFEELLQSSQEVNEMIWGAGLPTYKRLQRETKSYSFTFKEKEKSILYYVFEDEIYGTVVAYQYQIWINDGQKDENGNTLLTYYDVESGEVVAKYEQGATRFVQKTQTQDADARLVCEKGNYYYYAMPNYQNVDLVTASLYENKDEDEHYDFVRLDSAYKTTDDVKEALDAVYASVFAAPLYEYLFTGVVSATNEANQPAYFDYEDDEGVFYLMRSNETGSWKWRAPLPEVIFDFSSMKMVKGNAKKVTVTVDYRLAGSDAVKQMEVDFVLEGGAWYLNTPTFG